MVVGYESSLLEKEYAFQSAMENISAAKEQLVNKKDHFNTLEGVADGEIHERKYPLKILR